MSTETVWAKLQSLMGAAFDELGKAEDASVLTTLEKKYLGKKGEVQAYMQHMKELPPEERPKLGALVNEVRGKIESK